MYITQRETAAAVLLSCRYTQRLLLLRQLMRDIVFSAELLPYSISVHASVHPRSLHNDPLFVLLMSI
jgi:hypothetical protein